MFWGPISQVVVLKLGHGMWGPLHLWKKLGAVNSLPVVFHCSRYGFMAKLCLSLFYLFWCVFFFLICPTCRKSLSFQISFWGICSPFSCRFGVHMGRGEFSTFPHHNLEPEPDDLSFALKFKKFVITIPLRLFKTIGKYGNSCN